jgi:16S rRNA processing protein RimM
MRVPLPEGEFYPDEMLGWRVVTESGEELGELEEVIETPAHDVFATAQAMIPDVPDFIVKKDAATQLITVRDMPGLKFEE